MLQYCEGSVIYRTGSIYGWNKCVQYRLEPPEKVLPCTLTPIWKGYIYKHKVVGVKTIAHADTKACKKRINAKLIEIYILSSANRWIWIRKVKGKLDVQLCQNWCSEEDKCFIFANTTYLYRIMTPSLFHMCTYSPLPVDSQSLTCARNHTSTSPGTGGTYATMSSPWGWKTCSWRLLSSRHRTLRKSTSRVQK